MLLNIQLSLDGPVPATLQGVGDLLDVRAKFAVLRGKLSNQPGSAFQQVADHFDLFVVPLDLLIAHFDALIVP
jgi:hypothetical protein